MQQYVRVHFELNGTDRFLDVLVNCNIDNTLSSLIAQVKKEMKEIFSCARYEVLTTKDK